MLVSVGDYEGRAQQLLGTGSKAWGIPLLSSDRITRSAGQLHLFLLDATGEPPNTATCQAIQQSLTNLTFAGASVWVSPVETEEVDFDITLTVDSLSEDLPTAIFERLVSYLSPFTLGLGQTLEVKELEYVVRGTPGVRAIVSLLIDQQAVNRAASGPYVFPKLGTLTVSATDLAGYHKTYYIGTGIGDPI